MLESPFVRVARATSTSSAGSAREEAGPSGAQLHSHPLAPAPSPDSFSSSEPDLAVLRAQVARRELMSDARPQPGHPARGSHEYRVDRQRKRTRAMHPYERPRHSPDHSAGRRTDSFSEGSDERGVTAEQLADAEMYGGMRTRSRAELEMIKRRIAQMEAKRGVRNPAQVRRDSAPAAVATDSIPEQGVHASAIPSRASSSQAPIEIIINNAGSLPLSQNGGAGGGVPSPSSRWGTSLLPNTNSRTYQIAFAIMKAVLWLAAGGGAAGLTYTVARNSNRIDNNQSTIADLMSPPPPPF